MQLMCSNVFWAMYERGIPGIRPLHDPFKVETFKGNECVRWLGRLVHDAGPQPDVYEGWCVAAWCAFLNQGATWCSTGVPVGYQREVAG